MDAPSPEALLPQSDQFEADAARGEQRGVPGAHRARTGSSHRLPKPVKEKDGSFYA